MNSPTESSLQEILTSVVVGYDPVESDLNTPLKELPGWDSLARLNFIVECEEMYQIDLRATELASCSTIQDLLQLLKKRSN